MGSPLESGQVVHLDPLPKPVDEPARLDVLSRALAGVIADDLPLREEVWQLDEARAELDRRGLADAAASLQSRREVTVTLATCGETFALGLGPRRAPRRLPRRPVARGSPRGAPAAPRRAGRARDAAPPGHARRSPVTRAAHPATAAR
ncbi:MAG: hypothetical protein IPQ09_15260 [Myxococcales bacterium]|nr:hypothetical protein [Myxococcales bacterium]